MIKFAGMLFLVAGFCGLSFEKIKEEKVKLDNLKDIKNFVVYLLKEIQYSHIPIPDICNEYLKRSRGIFRIFLEEVCKQYRENEGKSFDMIWQETVKFYCINKEEKEHLKRLSTCFGYCNLGMQTAAIEQYLDEIKNVILQKEKKFCDNRKLIIYFGVMSGLLLSIILL